MDICAAQRAQLQHLSMHLHQHSAQQGQTETWMCLQCCLHLVCGSVGPVLCTVSVAAATCIGVCSAAVPAPEGGEQICRHLLPCCPTRTAIRCGALPYGFHPIDTGGWGVKCPERMQRIQRIGLGILCGMTSKGFTTKHGCIHACC